MKRPKDLTKEEWEELYEKYKTIKNVAKFCNFGYSTTIGYFKKHKINYNIQPYSKNFTKEELINLYKKLDSYMKIAEYLNCGPSTVHKYFKKFNIPHRQKYERKYSCDENFFENLSDNALYWLGFIAADGCVENNNGYSLIISLATKDCDQLINFKNDIKSNTKIINIKNDRSSENPKWGISYCKRITIHSKKINNSLEKYNIIPNKSLTLKFPKNLINHPKINIYIRGFIDGDGGYSLQKCNNILFKVSGTENFLKTLNNILVDNAELPQIKKTKKISQNGKIHHIQYNGNNICSKIVSWLYQDLKYNPNARYLDRKYQIIKHLIK